MRHFILLTAAMAALSLGCTSCEKIGDGPGNNPYKALELTSKSAEFARQGNDFAFHFIDRINASTTDDYVVSPLSMQFLLGMLLEGANGQTADEICSVLGYGASSLSRAAGLIYISPPVASTAATDISSFLQSSASSIILNPAAMPPRSG